MDQQKKSFVKSDAAGSKPKGSKSKPNKSKVTQKSVTPVPSLKAQKKKVHVNAYRQRHAKIQDVSHQLHLMQVVDGEKTAFEQFQLAKSSEGNVSSMANIKMKTCKYFDTSGTEATPYQQFQFDLYTNSPFTPSGATSGSTAACRVLTAKYYVLPRWSSDSSASSVMVLFSVPCYTSTGYDTSTPPTLTSVSQRSTLVQPAIDTSWIKVGEFNVKSFDSSDLRPAAWENGMQCLGSWCTADPDTGAATHSTPLQMKVEIIYEVTMPPVLNIKGAIVSSATQLFSDFVDKTTAVDLPAYGEPIGITHSEI